MDDVFVKLISKLKEEKLVTRVLRIKNPSLISKLLELSYVLEDYGSEGTDLRALRTFQKSLIEQYKKYSSYEEKSGGENNLPIPRLEPSLFLLLNGASLIEIHKFLDES
jgi:hypothetical protein